jgi:demethylsterigmatocystin 6-O-methyltransferase
MRRSIPSGDDVDIVNYRFDVHGPIVRAMPEFFKENNYQDIDSVTNTPFQKAHNTTLSPFEWFVQNPKHFEALQKVMTSLEGSEWTVGFDIFDSEALKVSSSSPQPSEKPFFVDVGGGHGHQCIQLGKKYPTLLGRMVLQDLPAAIDKLPSIEGVKAEAHDFFETQHVTGQSLSFHCSAN